MLPRALGNKVHHVSTQRAAAAQFCPGLCLLLPELHKPSAADGHNKQPWFKKKWWEGGNQGLSRLGLCTLPLCAAHCRHAGSPPPGSRGQEHGGRRAPHSSSAASPGTCPAGSARSPASASSHPTGWPWWPLPLAEREGMSKDISSLRRRMRIRDITQVFEVVQGRCLSSRTTSAWQARLLSAGTVGLPRTGKVCSSRSGSEH